MEFTNSSNELTQTQDDRYYRICHISFVVAFFQHALLAVLFDILGIYELALYNVFSIGVFAVANYLNEKRHFYIALTIAYIEILIHQTLATVYLGWDTGFHMFILFNIMLPLLTQKGHVFWKLVVSGSSFLVYLILLFFVRFNEPLTILEPSLISLFFSINIILFIVVLVLIARNFNQTVLRFEEKLQSENEYANSLLLNILPKTIAEQLGKKSGPIADGVPEASVLFADIVGFTSLAESIEPEQLVELLDNLFSRFDELTNKYGVEKIKTIGDAYMVAAGIPDKMEDHATRIVSFAQDILKEVELFNLGEEIPISVRIGIHSGPVVAGVIGKKKFSYDLWGDTVNTASRMESSGLNGEIQISGDTAKLLDDSVNYNSRGIITIKGKGEIETFIVTK